MSVIDYTIFDPSSGLASRVAAIRPAPLTLLGPYTITSATNGLTTGAPLVTLPIGAIIYDIGVAITVGFNGTTPKIDIGTFSGTHGLFNELAGSVIELTDPLVAVTENDGLETNGDSESWLQAAVASIGADAGNAFFPPAIYVSAISTLVAVVSQDGTKGGSATGATTGTALVYVLAATPSIS